MRTRRCLTAPALLSLLTLAFSTGCGSSATTSTATSPTSINRCAVTASGNGQVPAQGGPGSLAVSAARECVWSASAETQWLTIKTGATGQGDGAIEFNAAANADPVVRRGAIVLNEQRVEVSQAAGECVYSLSEASGSFPQAGGSGQFEVRASSTLCSWTAQSDTPWVSVRAVASRQGTATVQFDVSAATGQQRTATITAAGLRFTVVQAPAGVPPAPPTPPTPPPTPPTPPAPPTPPPAPPTPPPPPPAPPMPPACTYSLAPEQRSVDSDGASFDAEVTTPSGCAWSAVSNAPWITLNESDGNGSRKVKVTVAANPGPARSGTATIAGRTLTVNQAGAAPCSYKVSPLEMKIDYDRRSSRIEVKTADHCGWVAVSNAAWISVVSNPSGTGDADVTIGFVENKGAERTGTVTVAGQIVSVIQKAQK